MMERDEKRAKVQSLAVRSLAVKERGSYLEESDSERQLDRERGRKTAVIRATKGHYSERHRKERLCYHMERNSSFVSW